MMPYLILYMMLGQLKGFSIFVFGYFIQKSCSEQKSKILFLMHGGEK